MAAGRRQPPAKARRHRPSSTREVCTGGTSPSTSSRAEVRQAAAEREDRAFREEASCSAAHCSKSGQGPARPASTPRGP
eukprot:2027088-Lingulodinium_polyedra.AAC.1